MGSSPFYPKHQYTFYDTPNSTVPKSSRTFSFSSSSSSSGASSFFPDDCPSLPETPLHYTSGRVPFCWEKCPGIPKLSSHQKLTDPSLKEVLPLPPPASSSRRFSFNEPRIIRRSQTFSGSTRLARKDPFFAALMECSKDSGGRIDDYDDRELLSGGHKVSKSIGDRIGFVGMYISCKRTCSVSESMVYLPRSSGPARPSYDLLNCRR
ncbi:hypothetical protein LINGRAPRIM_LOCUS2449 [Linum grandiflorum]